MRRVIAWTGKSLVTLGLLVLLFVAYQLWGTGLYTARAQADLERQFEASRRQAMTETSATPTTPTRQAANSTTSAGMPPATTTAPPATQVPEGDAVARLVIPKISVDYYVIEGVGESDLRRGPGHYPFTALPGQRGNAAIAGHRTTYGAPFGELDSLEAGDLIQVSTTQGTFEYIVYDKLVVSPDALEVLNDDPERTATLTLTTCHPKYSAAQRLIIKAALELPADVQPLPTSVNTHGPRLAVDALADEGLSGDGGSTTPTFIAGLVAALIGGLWWLAFHRHPRWPTWIVGALPFAISLVVFYFYLERLLPANF